MEIVTYVRSGAITHQDSLGNKGRTAAGDVQVMSAGTGVTHAEYNLEDEDTTLFQIWIETDRRSAAAELGDDAFPEGRARRQLPDCSPAAIADDGALTINADARDPRRDARGGDQPCLSRPIRRATSIWSRRPRCGSTASTRGRATESPSPARTK